MGMPISLALRGRHADDARRPRPRGPRRWRSCARSTGCSAPTARTPSSSRLGRGEITVERVPRRGRARCSPSASGARASPAAPSTCGRPGPDGSRVLDPSGVVKGWAVERASRVLRRPRGHRLLPLRRRGHGVPRPDAGRARVADRHRGPARPAARRGRGPGRQRGGRDVRARPPRRPHRRRPRPGEAPTALASVTVVATRPDLGRHRRHRRLRPGRAGCGLAASPARADRAGGLGRRPHARWSAGPPRHRCWCLHNGAALRRRRFHPVLGETDAPTPSSDCPTYSPGATPGGTAKRPEPVCWRYSISASSRASLAASG